MIHLFLCSVNLSVMSGCPVDASKGLSSETIAVNSGRDLVCSCAKEFYINTRGPKMLTGR
jgi:hypothetical protein